MREIINKNQADILDILEKTVDAKHADLTEKTQIPTATYQREIADLREREMVFGTKAGSMHVMRLSITMAGIRALHDYNTMQARMAINPSVAVPARINVMADDYPAFKPAEWVPPRGNSLRNTRSLGAFAS